MLKAFSGRYRQRNLGCFVLALYSGFRVSELMSLKVGDLWDGKTIKETFKVEAKRMKGGVKRVNELGQAITKDGKIKKYKAKARTVQVNPEVHEFILPLLQGRPLDAPLILSQKRKRDGTERPLDRRSVWRIYNLAAKVADITKRVGSHTPRKCFGWFMYLSSDKDIVFTMHMLGQTSVESTKHYLGIGKEEAKQAFLKPRGLSLADIEV